MTAAPTKKRVAVLISGRGSNMTALIAAAADPAFPATIALVLSNRPDAAGLAVAVEANVPTAVVDHKPHGKDRAAFERILDETLRAAGIDIVCLAGFMRVLTPWFVERWTGRMLNIHPSLLPAFRGLDTHARALAEGVRLHGCTVHFVVPELDAGPAVMQAAVPVVPGDTPTSLATRVLTQEHRIYPAALALVASGAVALDADGRIAGPPAAEFATHEALVSPPIPG
ncbi:phosphoribosylglycinamide formyltransferase [Chelatococcus daeguensis]|uniref:phosphoribosylglycinamide formyltransferase n=1 Tax=Chelatococcus daeguensis TaxID=444444 RepID=UPI0007ABED0F|nr:phosphoribosylglycinamide formyltransferase [Chelatococcus daeguensis]KZE36658.1 phosphoribosylglycinamide formyltransferase [Chelatococcus daeguensis]MBM3082278.1 phosphoribosylglycinamide formyltransferase [Chelatococcus daeguensis]